MAAWPVTRPLFFLFGFLVFVYVAGIDRSYLVDQANYLDNFSLARTTPWPLARAEQQSLLQFLITQAVSEEILWSAWTAVLGGILNPATAVLVTVFILNALIVASAWRTASPESALLLWILLPVGFAVTGSIQIRQGFALAVMLVLALGPRRPTLGAAVAAMLHTTFALALVFAAIGRLFKSKERTAFALTVLVAFLGAYLGAILFEIFGGRRLLTYVLDEGATSINYVFTGLLMILPSVYWIFRDRRADDDERIAQSISQLALIHIGVTAFTLFSFFFFPLGAGRPGYITQLLLIPILPAVAARRGVLPKAIFGLLLVYLLYLVGKSYLEGSYELYLRP
jgi:hypothetical protein